MHIKLVPLCPPCPITLALLPSNLLLLPFTARCTTPTLCFMAGETIHDLPPIDEPVDDDTKGDSQEESTALTTSSSPTSATVKMVDGKILELSDFFKKTSFTEPECQAYHDHSWLPGSLISTIPEVDVPNIHDSTVICFESHLIARLGLTPSKFLVAVMNYLVCELVHFNPNAITTLSYFTMLCECWLGIALDTSLFWYYYSLARYDKVVYSRIGLSLRHNHWNEFIEAAFMGC
jgi:hypothetical protein